MQDTSQISHSIFIALLLILIQWIKKQFANSPSAIKRFIRNFNDCTSTIFPTKSFSAPVDGTGVKYCCKKFIFVNKFYFFLFLSFHTYKIFLISLKIKWVKSDMNVKMSKASNWIYYIFKNKYFKKLFFIACCLRDIQAQVFSLCNIMLDCWYIGFFYFFFQIFKVRTEH